MTEFTTLGQWDRSRIAEEAPVNNTPEPINTLLPGLTKKVTNCGWCVSAHVAESICRCEGECGVAWCAPKLTDFTDDTFRL